MSAGRSRSTSEPTTTVSKGTMAVMMPMLVAVVVPAATYIRPWYKAMPRPPRTANLPRLGRICGHCRSTPGRANGASSRPASTQR
ncbi:Uncharacterised protein [Bordetella pertussis]|nr:Uncharacterised protein [Bordetella pertussis]CPJ11765.1 Uncharacterised protein [Bordetella pertussis]CPK11953.1 Uncharacterised protein [Bordetella pertussis]CPO29953.1 Uncharacterised protein [Bordetella pertussis]